MEVVVHGTKGGYRVLYKTQGAPSIASDIRNNADSQSSMGKSVYSIALVTNGVVYSKYKIVSDTLRSSATGFIAFSLFLPTGEKSSGVDTKSILDELLDHYVNNYIITNQMNRGERIQIIPEEWAFISDILSKYTTTRDAAHNQLQPGVEDAAFIYYNGNGELIDYLAKPFQEEYCNYKQVFLINNELKINSDILNVLRNSGVELKNIDLKNEYFYLNNYDRSKGINITANGKTRSDGKNNNLIRAKDKIEIKYNKDDRYYEPIEAKGSISDTSSDIYKYLDVTGNQILLKYDEFNYPTSKTKTLILDIKDINGNPVDNPLIICKSGFEPKTVNNNQIIFKGEDLGKQWTVTASKGDNWFLENHPIDLIRDCPGDIVTISLKLKERKKVVFVGILNGSQISDLKITIGHKGINEGPPKAEFINEEINKTYIVTATYQKGGEKFSGQKSFSPKYDNTVYLDLEKVIIKEYSIDEGENGIKKQNCPGYSNSKTGDDVKPYIKPKRGWKFTGFKLENSESKDYDGKLVAQYTKKYNPYIIAASILSVLIISAGTWWFWSKGEVQNTSLAKHTVKGYVEGIELNINTLKSYKTKWENQNSGNKNEENSQWYNPMTWLKSEDQNSESNSDPKWQEASEWIDVAIKKRNSVDNWDFMILKDSTKYFEEQLKFKNAIMKIDSTQYDIIQKRFNNVSQWNLNQIADSINNFLKTKDSLKIDSSEKKEVLLVEEVDKTKHKEVKKVVDKAKNNNQSKEETQIEKSQKNESGNTSISKDIQQKLKSGTITVNQLKEYRNDNSVDFKNSIDLYLEFWKLVTSNSNQKNDFDDLLKKINKDITLRNSELKSFLEVICENSKKFQQYNDTPGKAILKTVNELKTKVQ